MRYVKPFVASILLSILYSCDPDSNISYEIIYKTKDPIIVRYKFGLNLSDTSLKEIIIQGDSSKTLYFEQPLGHVDNIDERSKSIIPINYLQLRQGSILTTLNFKDKKYWKFEKINNQEGIYKLIIDTMLFKQ